MVAPVVTVGVAVPPEVAVIMPAPPSVAATAAGAPAETVAPVPATPMPKQATSRAMRTPPRARVVMGAPQVRRPQAMEAPETVGRLQAVDTPRRWTPRTRRGLLAGAVSVETGVTAGLPAAVVPVVLPEAPPQVEAWAPDNEFGNNGVNDYRGRPFLAASCATYSHCD